MNSNTLPLENIDDAGSPPESRLSSADAVVDLVKMLTRADEEILLTAAHSLEKQANLIGQM